MRTVFREIRSSRTIWRIGFRSTQNARLTRPIVSTVTIPGPLPQRNQREHSMIRRVGPYSTLITLQAGSLFHAVFHQVSMLHRELLLGIDPDQSPTRAARPRRNRRSNGVAASGRQSPLFKEWASPDGNASFPPHPAVHPGRSERRVCATLPPFGGPWVNETLMSHSWPHRLKRSLPPFAALLPGAEPRRKRLSVPPPKSSQQPRLRHRLGYPRCLLRCLERLRRCPRAHPIHNRTFLGTGHHLMPLISLKEGAA